MTTDLRKERKQQGLCVQCGVKLDRKGTCCIRCNDLNNASKAIIVNELHDNNQCSTCKKPLDRDGWFCKVCCKKLKLRARIRTAERRARGLCTQCGTKTEGTVQCRRCLDMLADRRNKKKNKINGGK